MFINNIKISAIGGIASFETAFNRNLNIICGPNSAGKTTILECIAHSFTANKTKILRRNVRYESGRVETHYTLNDNEQLVEITIDKFSPRDPQQLNGAHDNSNQILSFKTGRQIVYQQLDAVSADITQVKNTYEELKTGISALEIKNWFVNRYLYSAHESAISDVQNANLELAKSIFNKIDARCSFSRVDASNNDIMVFMLEDEIYGSSPLC